MRTKVFRGGNISTWEIGERIGAGAYCRVFSSRDDIAVKVYNFDAKSTGSFLNECMILHKITHHPNVVKAVDSGANVDWQGEIPYLFTWLAFERWPTTLSKWLRCSPIPPANAKDIAMQLIAGLAHVHSCGVIHGDIKPGNILVDPATWRIALADFGSSARCGAVEHCCIGTVPWLPPEFLLEHIDSYCESSDIWPLALTLYTIFTGENLFDVDNEYDSFYSDYIEMPAAEDNTADTSSEEDCDSSEESQTDQDDRDLNTRLLAIIYTFIGPPPKRWITAPRFQDYYSRKQRNVLGYPKKIGRSNAIDAFTLSAMTREQSPFGKHVLYSDPAAADEYQRNFAGILDGCLKYEPVKRTGLAEIRRLCEHL